MKNTFYMALLAPALALGQSSDQNYIRTRTYKQPSAVSIPDPAPEQASTAVTYFDGMGRPVQQVAVGQSASGRSIIVPMEYDAFGRQEKEYLPYASQGPGAGFVPDALSQVLSYPDYQGHVPYSQKQFEASPLDRVLQQSAPGSAWAMGSGHEIRTDYLANTPSDAVKRFRAQADWDASQQLFTAVLVQNGTYGGGELYKTVTKDENWTSGNGNTAEEFKNAEGQVVLRRAYGESMDGGVLSFAAHDTYYVYDQYGNLSYVLPPLSSDPQSELDGLCYQYRYDSRNRLAEKKLPGKQWEGTAYDLLDRPAASGPVPSPFGDGEQGWLITKYDAFNRVAYTGWLSTSRYPSRLDLQEQYNAAGANLSEARMAGGTVDGIDIGYTSAVFPAGGIRLLTASYYDDYSFPGGPSGFGPVEGEPVYYNLERKPKGLPTGSWVRVPQEAGAAAELSHTLYDSRGRAIQTKKTNWLGGHTTISTKLDFSGKALYKVTRHARTAGIPDLYVKETFTYTAQDRLLSHVHQVGENSVPQLLAMNEYDELGRLAVKRVGGADLSGSAPLQKIDYAYNIRGWLKEINKTDNLSQAGQPQDLFAFKINYETAENPLNGQVKPLFNGNISETFWKTSSDNTLRSYGYAYDRLSRLSAAFYQKAGLATGAYDETAAYDKNGNILRLSRNGGLDAQYPALEIDDLAYSYHPQDRNRLMGVYDQTLSPKGFRDGTSGNTDDYTYDAYGNLTSDRNKRIFEINYNHLNLPLAVIFQRGGDFPTISYIYDVAGAKVRKIVNQATRLSRPVQTDYLDGFQYVDGVLQFFPTAEGYVKHEEGTYSYVYNYTDHLGNVRLSYTERNGVLEIVEENNYYPFGLKHEGYNGSEPTVYQYKFQNKEWQDELSLNLYDFGGRLYDPAIVRTTTMDPLAEKFYNLSPQSFLNNNPLSFIDPTGMSSDWFDEKAEKQAQKTEKAIDKKITELNKGNASDKNDRIVELQKSKSDISDMRNDKSNQYKFDKSSNNGNRPETKRTGAGEITIFTDDAGKQIHENRHGGQIARGEYNVDMSGNVTSGTAGASKEIDAYKAQYSFEGKIEYVPSIDFSNQTNVLNFAMKGTDGFKKTITNMGQINNTFLQTMVDNPGLNQTPIYPDPAVNPTYYKQ